MTGSPPPGYPTLVPQGGQGQQEGERGLFSKILGSAAPSAPPYPVGNTQSGYGGYGAWDIAHRPASQGYSPSTSYLPPGYSQAPAGYPQPYPPQQQAYPGTYPPYSQPGDFRPQQQQGSILPGMLGSFAGGAVLGAVGDHLLSGHHGGGYDGYGYGGDGGGGYGAYGQGAYGGYGQHAHHGHHGHGSEKGSGYYGHTGERHHCHHH